MGAEVGWELFQSHEIFWLPWNLYSRVPKAASKLVTGAYCHTVNNDISRGHLRAAFLARIGPVLPGRVWHLSSGHRTS